MKRVNVTLEDDQHDRLAAVKGDRTWREALLDEFGLDESEDQDEIEVADP